MQWSFGCFTGKKLAAWKWFSLGLVDTTLFVCNCSFQSWDKSMQHVFSKGLQKFIHTGKSFSEALILASVNPQMVFCFCFDIQNNICTQNVLNLYFSGNWMNWMNNLSSYCGLTDSRMRASDTDLPYVQVNLFQKVLFLHQLTHNMTKNCSLSYQLSTWKFLARNIMCT